MPLQSRQQATSKPHCGLSEAHAEERMLAKDIMKRDVAAVTCGTSLADAARLMLERGVNGLPVLDAEGRVVGMIGIRDILRVPTPSRSTMPILKWARLEEKAELLGRIRVDQVMARQVISVNEDARVIDVAALMANRGVHPIPVLRNGSLVGVIGRADVARLLLDLASRQPDRSTVTPSANVVPDRAEPRGPDG